MADNIVRWLEGLGLGQYVQAFADNEIDSDILPELSEDDLRELGLPMGPRKKLLKAIADSYAQSDPNPAISDPVKDRTSEAERRQLTVMFCDLVGSTELSASLDPEDYRAVMTSYQEAVSAAVARFDGHVAKYLGDGILAFFGWPRAHEDDAERSVRAAFGIIETLAEHGVQQNHVLQARVGIATGNVVVGDLVGERVAEEGAVSGETPNLAARVQSLAAPGTVVVTDGTRRLLGRIFDCDDLGSYDLKGISQPVRVWRIGGERRAESRFDVARTGRLTPFVGREQEIALLIDRWERAKEGDGQVVLLSGEAGIGKSRITQALRDHVEDEPHTRLRFQCSPHYESSALHPIIAQLEGAAGFAPEDTAAAKLYKLEQLLAQSADDVLAVAPLFAALLSVPFEGRYPPLEMTPQHQMNQTLVALTDQVIGLAALQPVLLIFEDAHWADPTTLEVLEQIIGRTENACVLTVITFRPEFEAPWRGYSNLTTLALNRLTRSQCGDMVLRVTSGKLLPKVVLDQIVAKTDGVPLFVEELTKSMLESGILIATDDAYTLEGPLPPLAIPATLQDSLMARLDRLAPIKEVAQIGAAIGREFPRRLIAAVSRADEDGLDDALSQLVEAELVFRRGTGTEATYMFKHALVQDAAYASLLISTRQELHQRIAIALEDISPEIAETAPEILAHHYTEAGLAEQAISQWQRAGTRASERSANLEAISHLSKGLEVLKSLPESPKRTEQELALLIALTGPLIAAKSYSAAETQRVYSRALEICNQIGETHEIFPVLYGPQVFHLVAGQISKAHELAREFSRLAEIQENDSVRMVGFRLLGTASTLMGQPLAAREQLEQSISLYRSEQHRSLTFFYGQDVKVAALSSLHLSLWLLGYPDQALEKCQEAISEARTNSHVNTLCYALAFAGILRVLRRQEQATGQLAEEIVTLCAQHEAPLWAQVGRSLIGWWHLQEGQNEGAITTLQESIPAYQALPASFWTPIFFIWLSEAYREVGLSEEASQALDEALAIVNQNDERWFEAEVYRLKGELLFSDLAGNVDEAEAAFRKAIAVAQSQKAKSLELRATASLARLWSNTERCAEARDLLAPVYGWFTEGLDTADLKEAKALLDELS